MATCIPPIYKHVCMLSTTIIAETVNKEICSLYPMSTYAERLNKAMSHLGMSQSELARRVAEITKNDKVKPQTIQALAAPKKKVQGSKYTHAIAEALHIRSAWLASGDGEMTDSTAGEAVSDRAFIPGSTLKGILRSRLEELSEQLSDADAKLLLSLAERLAALQGHMSEAVSVPAGLRRTLPLDDGREVQTSEKKKV